MGKVRKNFTLDSDLAEWFARYAEENRATMSAIINRWIFEKKKEEASMKKFVLSPDAFAEALGFEHYEALISASETVHTEGDIDWFVTTLPDGRFAAWDDAELALDRVEYFNHYYEAEDYQILGAAAKIKNAQEQFLFVLRALEEILDRSHREGHCEHAGYCEVIPVLRKFLESPEGEKSLELLGDWYGSETPSELFSKLAGDTFVSADWIHEDELPAWMQAVKEAEIEHAVE